MKKTVIFSIYFCLIISFSNHGYAGENNADSTGIKFSCYNWLPMNYENDKGIPSGLYIDILNEVFVNQLGIPLSTRFRPWKRAQVEVRKGITDFLITVATRERLKYSTKSNEPFFLLYLYIYTYANHPLANQIDQIKSPEDIVKLNLTAVTNLGNGWHKSNMEAKGVKTHYVRLEDSALGFLSLKRADIMIDALISTNHLIRKKGLSSKIQLTKARFGPLKMHLLMSNQSPFLKLMPEINEAFKNLQDEGVINEIISRYSSLKQSSQYNPGIFAGELK